MPKKKRIAEVLAANVRAARIAAGLSQEGLARSASLSSSYVSMLERGERTPSLATIETLAGALGLDPVRLFAA